MAARRLASLASAKGSADTVRQVRLRPSSLLGFAAVALAAAGLVGVVAYYTTAGQWVDGNALGGFASLKGSPAINEVASAFAHSANVAPFALFTLVLLGAALATRGPRRAASVMLLLAGANLSCAVLKPNLFPPR